MLTNKVSLRRIDETTFADRPRPVLLNATCFALLPIVIGCGTSADSSNQNAPESPTTSEQVPVGPGSNAMPVPTEPAPGINADQVAMPSAQPRTPVTSTTSAQPQPVPMASTAPEPTAPVAMPSAEPDGAGGTLGEMTDEPITPEPEMTDEPITPEPEMTDVVPVETDIVEETDVEEPIPEPTLRDGVCPAGVEFAAPAFDAPFELVMGDPEDLSGLLEGVIWVAERGVLMHTELVFSGEYPSRLFEYTPGGGIQELTRSFWLNGLALTANDDVLGTSYNPPGIAAVVPEAQELLASMTPTATSFNSPNDLIIRSDSNVYFTDPTHQLNGRESETGITGVYRLDPSGVVTVEESELQEPNGLALSPDEQLLYVGSGPVESGGIVVYDVQADGGLSNRRQFASIGGTDGMTMDCAGNLYVVEHEEGIVHVIAPGGNVLGTLDTPPKAGNLAFGGPDRQTLYVTVSRALMSRPSTLPGYPY